jgi:hypothetical protein
MAKRGRDLRKAMWPRVGSPPLPRHVAKIGRNEPCPCGSGKKYKECHEKDGEAFLEKLARRRDQERLREVRAELKARGVAWYRRIFVRL